MEGRVMTTETPSCAAAPPAGVAAPAAQPRTALVIQVLARMEGHVLEEEMPSLAYAKTAGKDPHVHRMLMTAIHIPATMVASAWMV